jgi:hypothetical protein
MGVEEGDSGQCVRDHELVSFIDHEIIEWGELVLHTSIDEILKNDELSVAEMDSVAHFNNR